MIAATPRFVSAAPLVFSMSNEPVSPQFPEDCVPDDHLEARAELEWRSPPSLAMAAGNGRVRYISKYESSSSEAFPDTPSFASISDSPNTPVFDELESDHSLDRQQPGRLTKSALLTLTRAVHSQFARPVVSLGLAETQHRPNGTWLSGGCPKGPKRRAA